MPLPLRTLGSNRVPSLGSLPKRVPCAETLVESATLPKVVARVYSAGPGRFVMHHTRLSGNRLFVGCRGPTKGPVLFGSCAISFNCETVVVLTMFATRTLIRHGLVCNNFAGPIFVHDTFWTAANSRGFIKIEKRNGRPICSTPKPYLLTSHGWRFFSNPNARARPPCATTFDKKLLAIGQYVREEAL